MLKCPDCNKPIRQYMATSRDTTTKRYYLCKKCENIFIETVDISNMKNLRITDTEKISIKKEESKQASLEEYFKK